MIKQANEDKVGGVDQHVEKFEPLDKTGRSTVVDLVVDFPGESA